MLTVEEALTKITETVRPTIIEQRTIVNAIGSILAEPIVSDVDSPPFEKSMMDGYALRATDCQDGATLKVIDEVTAGRVGTVPVAESTAVRIMTGAPIPDGADAVVPIELTSFDESTNEVTLTGVKPGGVGQHILPRGLVMSKGEQLMSPGRCLAAADIALLAELGREQIAVRGSTTFAILSTGDELVPHDAVPGPGQIRNTNGVMLADQVQQVGGTVAFAEIARDTREDLREKIATGLNCDVLCLSGGVSAGKLDLVPSELAAAGVEEVFHKAAMKPGKPIWFGVCNKDSDSPTYVFGLPGNPVSSMVCFELFVRTALRQLQGAEQVKPEMITAKLTDDFHHRSDRQTYFPAHFHFANGECIVRPVNWKGSADLRSTIDANASICFPAEERNFQAGEQVEVLPWSGPIRG